MSEQNADSMRPRPTREAIAKVQDSYEAQCEQLWEDMVFEFTMKYRLDEEEARSLLEEP